VGFRCLATEVPDAVERLLRHYLDERSEAENLRAYFARQSDEDLRAVLAGAPLPAVERDLASGLVAQGVGE
jgi:sulfite reductase (ferredoxin)